MNASRKHRTISPDDQVQSRLVLNFPGFEQTDSTAQIGRLIYGAGKTGRIWGFDVTDEEPQHAADTHFTTAKLNATGGNWNCDVNLVQFRWNDIVHTYEKETFPAGYLKNLIKYFAFFTDGTVGKYRRASLRYWGFTIFPILLMAIFMIITWFASGYLTQVWPLRLLVTLAVSLIFCKWPGDKLYLPLTIADWGFARDMVNRTNPEIENRFEEFGAVVSDRISNSKEDEIIIVGHSFGSLWAVAALGIALKKQPDLLKKKKVTILALGSSMLKIALAREAEFMREYWQQVMAEKNVFWHEVQTKDDLIAFYKCNPFDEVGITYDEDQLAITKMRFSAGMERKRYKAMRRSFYRTHRQYILYYDQRVSFDYMLRLFGPLKAKLLANDDKAHKRLDADGRLV